MYVFDVILFFNVRLLSVLRDQSFFSSPPQRPMTSDSEGFPSQMLSITFLSYLYSSERASISLFNVECQTRELLVPLHYICCPIFILPKEPVFPFLMLRCQTRELLVPLHYICCPIFILQKEPVFPFWIFSAEQRH